MTTRLWWRKLIAIAVIAVPTSLVGPALIPSSGLLEVAHAESAALSFDAMKSVDIMKYTKDVMTNQPTDAEIAGVIAAIKEMGANFVALSIPLDKTSDYPAYSTPRPRTAESFTQAWADAAHNAGLGIIWRGTYAGIEGIYGFAHKTGENRLPAGTAVGAAQDGSSTWLGKIYSYITEHPSYFRQGDVWAPLPERTEGIFSDATSFLSHDGAGIQKNYSDFFADLKTVSDAAFAKIGVQVLTGLTANNYSEIATGWLPQSVFDSANYVSVDYYGSDHTPAEMERDLRMMARTKGKPVFLQEWGDYWNAGRSESERSAYLSEIYAVLEKLVREGIVVGFNYWGGWDNDGEGVLKKDGSSFGLNYRASFVKNFFAPKSAQAAETPSAPTPASVPVPIPAPEPDPLPAPAPVEAPIEPAAPAPTPITGTSAIPSAYCSAPGTEQFTGCYYADRDMRSFLHAQADKSISFRWNDGSPASAVPTDLFAARWQGNFTFAGGIHEFTVAADDGVRLRIDHELVLDEWYDKAASPRTISVELTPGIHYIEMEYYEAYGGAVAELNWK